MRERKRVKENQRESIRKRSERGKRKSESNCVRDTAGKRLRERERERDIIHSRKER